VAKSSRKSKLTAKQYLTAVVQVAKETYKAAPIPSVIQLSGTFVTAILPIITTYFAALTTTALADAYVGKEGAGQLAIEYVIITSALGILLTAWRSLEQYISQAMRYRVEAAMSDRMYEHFLSLDFWRYDDKDTADLYDRASDFSRFFPYVFQRVSSLLSYAIGAVVSIGALVIVNWWISLIMIIAIIPSVYIQFRLSRMQVAHRNAHVATRRSKNFLEWILGDQKKTAELRLYGVVKHMLNLRMQLRDKDEKARIDFERQFIAKQLGADALQAAAEVVALVFIVLEIIARHQPIGQFIYVQQVVGRVLSSTNSFVSQLSTLDEDLANLFDYQEFMRLPVRKAEGGSLMGVPETIAIKGVSFKYPQSTAMVLNNVNLKIKRGQHVAIVGENGAGKSTLVKILTGLYEPTKGDVMLDDIPLKEVNIGSWHGLLAVLQQDALSYPFVNARDNVLFGDVDRPVDEARYVRALEKAEAKTFVNKLAKGDKTYVNPWMEDEEGNKGTDLSGGQWQRLALARNFYRDSPIIILDEPTSAIDALAETRIFEHLFADAGRTVITISHRLTTIEKADIVYMLQNGKVVEQGTHKELVALHDAYYTMFESQLRSK
jgi:ATP-binding cassette, subfamily B, bacterial